MSRRMNRAPSAACLRFPLLKCLATLLLLPLALVAEPREIALRGSAAAKAMGEHVDVMVALVGSDDKVITVREDTGSAAPRPRPSLTRSMQGYREQTGSRQAAPLLQDASRYMESVSKLVLDVWLAESAIGATTKTGKPNRCALTLCMLTGDVRIADQDKALKEVDPRLLAALGKLRLPRPPVFLRRQLGLSTCMLVTIYSLEPSGASAKTRPETVVTPGALPRASH